MKGIGVSPGISIGRAFVLRKSEHRLSRMLLSDDESISIEIEKFNEAVKISISEVEAIIKNNELKLQTEDIEILEIQIRFLHDPQVRSEVLERINRDHNNAHDAILLVVQRLIETFNSGDDDYMNARPADIQDIGNRILRHLNRSFHDRTGFLPKDTIIIAEDISPSEAVNMDLKHVIGFATQVGSKTSHTAILAKAKGIPAVVACGEKLGLIRNNDIIIIDGRSGHVLFNPDKESLEEYIRLRADHLRMTEALKSLMDINAVTSDGEPIRLMANISHPDDLEDLFDNGGQGVGLFRTEMLFIGRNNYPSEDEQFIFYRELADKSNNIPVTIRTIDIGGDKQCAYLELPEEQNPFLGFRAIRICLDQPDLFITQLKAVLRASIYGNFKIMFPMISNLKELRDAKAVLELAKAQLQSAGIPFDEGIEVGIMIEVPSAALIADLLAKEVDFFSIGTNDLCQYAIAVDRSNEKIQDLYQTFHPGLLRLIRYVIDQANKYRIPVGMCGEMASDPRATKMLIGMGLREFSMNTRSITMIKEIILNTSIARSTEIFERVMEMESSEDILKYLEEDERPGEFRE